LCFPESILTFCANPHRMSIYIGIECEAEELSDIRQYDAVELKNARIGWEWTTLFLLLPLRSSHILSWYKDDENCDKEKMEGIQESGGKWSRKNR